MVRYQGVGGSNPLAPTIHPKLIQILPNCGNRRVSQCWEHLGTEPPAQAGSWPPVAIPERHECSQAWSANPNASISLGPHEAVHARAAVSRSYDANCANAPSVVPPARKRVE